MMMPPSATTELARWLPRVAGCVLVLALLVVAVPSCSEDETAPPCDDSSCPAGCCDGDQCVSPATPWQCGLHGVACADCTADGRADQCSGGVCICAAAGEPCAEGLYCSSTGCGTCPPECAGKCAGADDGCGGVCTLGDCTEGCCDAQHLCVAVAAQGDDRCGSSGADCGSCVQDPQADQCVDGACQCAATGARCDDGLFCSSSGCGSCEPQCAGKCAGADDGCGSPCPASDCADGCCDGDGLCVPYGSQGDALCGADGAACVDCSILGYTCDGGLHACQSGRPNDALFVDQSVPLIMASGEQVSVTITLQNIGSATWSEAAGHRLGAQNPQDNSTWGVARVQLGANETVAPGGFKSFAFQITAPATADVLNFQWRMLQEGQEWFGDFTEYLPITVGQGAVTVCESIRNLAGTQTDAASPLQICIDATPAGGVLELPAGIYRMDSQVQIQSAPITLRTENLDASMPKCALDNHGCAELKASTAFADTGGILLVTPSGSVVDHIVLNGNKTERVGTLSAQECAAFNNAYGHNMRTTCDDCVVMNSVSMNSLCGTGCEVVGTGAGVVLWRNTIAQNGVHHQAGMWADGVTVHDRVGSTVAANEFIDNTDVDLIFGGCASCMIQGNVVSHTAAFEGGCFAAFMIHAWPTTSGDFTGSFTTRNHVDCGPERRCGFGLLLGSDAWYLTEVYGGEVFLNTVDNAEQGVALDDVHDMVVFNNHVSNPASSSDTSCGPVSCSSYSMGSGSYNVDISRDTMGASYTDQDWDGCIPNWWN